MIGYIYRYPHPTEVGKFLYVGQGKKRDKDHRSGRSSFGRRFKRDFPGVELPQPIREVVEVENQLELNELETIWMFQYHTWRDYESGMNITLPGSQDYKNASKLALLSTTPMQRRERSRLAGLKAVKTGQFFRICHLGGLATNDSTNGRKGNGGRISGRISAESGNLAKARLKITPEMASANGRRQVENGTLARICVAGGQASIASLISKNPDHQRKAGRAAAVVNIASGQLERIRNLPKTKAARLQFNHNRWHVKRGIINPACELCQHLGQIT